MATKYWVGGSGYWDMGTMYPTHWSATSGGAAGSTSKPTYIDDVIFDANSGSGNYSVGFNGSPACRNINISNPSGGILSIGHTSYSLFVYGDMIFGSGVLISSARFKIYFIASSGIQNLTTNGVYMPIFSLQGGSTVKLLDDLYKLPGYFQYSENPQNGHFDFNGKTVIFSGNDSYQIADPVVFYNLSVIATGANAELVLYHGVSIGIENKLILEGYSFEDKLKIRSWDNIPSEITTDGEIDIDKTSISFVTVLGIASPWQISGIYNQNMGGNTNIDWIRSPQSSLHGFISMEDVVSIRPLDTYLVQFKSTSNGNVMGKTVQAVTGGVAEKVTAVPAFECSFVNWTVGGTEISVDNPLILDSVTADKVVTANFEKIKIVTEVDEVSINEGFTAILKVKLSAEPEANKVIATAKVSGDTNITVSAGASLTFTPANWDTWQNVTLAAAQDADTDNGTAIIRLTCTGLDYREVTAIEVEDDTPLTITNDGHGTTVPTGAVANTIGVHRHITAIPATGYRFLNWTSEDGAVFGNADLAITTVTISEPATITANFVIKNLTVIFTAGEHGILERPLDEGTEQSSSFTETIDYGGSSKAVTAVADTDYHFVNWTGSVSLANPLTLTNVTSSKNIKANFAIDIGKDLTFSGGTVTGYIGTGGTVTIPTSYKDNEDNIIAITAIGEKAFYGQNGIIRISIPSTITSIGASAFEGCAKLVKAVIPASVTEIGALAFANCTNLTQANFLGAQPTMPSTVFYNCNSGFVIYRQTDADGWTNPPGKLFDKYTINEQDFTI